MTGLHHVCDFHCNGCDATLGWKYVRLPPPPPHKTREILHVSHWMAVERERATSESHTPAHTQELAQDPKQKYKEGKYIVEKAMVRKVQFQDMGSAA